MSAEERIVAALDYQEQLIGKGRGLCDSSNGQWVVND
jgi:hypothetical protein